MKRPTLIARALNAFLLAALITPPQVAHADVTAGSMATNTLNGINSTLGDMNSFMNTFGSSSAQLQSMAMQLQQAQAMAGGLQQQQSAFDQIQNQLNLAKATAMACITKTGTVDDDNTYAKYYAKRPADQKSIVKGLTPDTLTSVEPTCSTYGVILDAIEMNKAKLVNTNKKMTCITNFQNQVNQIADAAKAPFAQLTNAATEVQKTYTQIIEAHTKIADKITNDLDGPADKDGKHSGGYRGQLANLKSMALELNNVLNAKSGDLKTEGGANDQGLKYGLVKAVESLKKNRVDAANSWYYNMMGDVENCYHSQPAGSCFANDVGDNLSPDQCLATMVANQGDGTTSGGRKARAREDSNSLAQISVKNYMSSAAINLPANIDINNPDAFLNFAQSRFQSTLMGVLGAYRAHNYTLGLDKGAITKYVSDAYQACFDKAKANFQSDMTRKSGTYYDQITAAQDNERTVANDEKNWIDRVEQSMTDFRTSFQKTYSSDLAQFKTDCTDEGDPYKGLDCLRILNAELQSGMRGTTAHAKLMNGSTFTVTAGATVLPVQTLTLDAQGKPTIGSSSVTCSGFDDCITYLSNSRDQHAQAADQTTQDRQKFVDQHNASVKQAFGAVSAQFAQMSQLLVASVAGVNDDLAKLGVKASMKTKDVDGEDLKENDKTGLYDMPKSMKAAFAGSNAYSELDDSSSKDVADAYNTMIGDLNKKSGDAQKMKEKCKINKGEYQALAGIMPNDCSSVASVCSTRDRAASGISQMEAIFDKSKVSPDDNPTSLSRNSEYNSCKSQTMQQAAEPTASEIRAAAREMDNLSLTLADGHRDDDHWDEAREQAILKKKTAATNQVRTDCGDVIFPPLDALARQGRGPLESQNEQLVKLLRDVSDACANVKPDPSSKDGSLPTEDDDVTRTCEAFKSAANKAEPPAGEAETGVPGTGVKSSSDPAINPFGTSAK
ncbi:MAG: hypothetical protein ACXVB9_11515 [Bdellovibrionota bacterium]